MSSLYDSVRASVDHSTTGVEEERVEVNQRALIDKILARYASAGTTKTHSVANPIVGFEKCPHYLSLESLSLD